MNAFDSFLRFFSLADDNSPAPQNALLPEGAYPNLPVVGMDMLRWLVNPSDVAGGQPEQVTIGMRPRSSSGVGTICGRLRPQAGATYQEIRLRIEAPADGVTWKQFAIQLGDTPVLGTFRGQQTTLEEYITAIQKFLLDFPYGFTEVDRIGYDLRIRVYGSDKFRLSGEPLTIGLGNVTQRNPNSPSLIAQLRPNVSFPAEDRYTLVVSGDIQKGNVFVLDNKSVTATGTEKPADLLAALGVPASGLLSRAAGVVPSAYAQPGTQLVENANRPVLQLLFQNTVSGSDRYLARITGTVATGNVYQISVPGQPTRTVTATGTDTADSLAAQFNTTGGYCVMPTGSLPGITTLAGTQTIGNTNNPALSLTKRTRLAARVLNANTVYVGPSVVAGNSYTLTVGAAKKTVVADAGDTPLSIATRLGYDENPFSVNVAPGVPVSGLAKRGPLYHAGENLASVRLMPSPSAYRLPYVAEVRVPTGLPAGDYQFTLVRDGVVFALSNGLVLKPSTKDTALVRFGTDRPQTVFGLTYNEDGLFQQLRLPLYVETGPALRQSETISRTLDYRPVRGLTEAWFVHGLVSDLQGAAFHRNLFTALKHPVLHVGGKPYTCEGELSLSGPQGRRRRQQATANLTAREGLVYEETSSLSVDSLPATYAQIKTVSGGDGLWMVARYRNFVQTLTPGTVLPAADYEILLRAGIDSQQVTIAQSGSRIGTFLAAANSLNRFRVRLAPGEVSITLKRVNQTVSGRTLLPNYALNQDALLSGSQVEQTERAGEFTDEFTDDFAK